MVFPAQDNITSYGGLFNNYLVSPTDSTTDQDAAQYNAHAASTAGMTHTGDIAWCRFVTSATTPTLATTNAHDAAWGNAAGVAPVLARTAQGVFTVTWPSSITDGTNATQTVNIRRATATIEGNGTFGLVQVSVTSGNVITVYTATTVPAASDLVGVTIHVRAG